MKIKNFLPFILTTLFCFLMETSPLVSQELPACKVLSVNDDGTYVVEIRGDTLLAVTAEFTKNAEKIKSDLGAAKKRIALKDSVIATFERVENKYGIIYNEQKEYVAELEEVLEGYKRLAKGYKKLSGEPCLTFSGGLGATGGDEKPVVLAGLGIRRLRVWGILQESNAGVAIGLSFPLF